VVPQLRRNPERFALRTSGFTSALCAGMLCASLCKRGSTVPGEISLILSQLLRLKLKIPSTISYGKFGCVHLRRMKAWLNFPKIPPGVTQVPEVPTRCLDHHHGSMNNSGDLGGRKGLSGLESKM